MSTNQVTLKQIVVMLISEFIDRTGFRPTEDYYHTEIEPEYNSSNLDKDAWCKQWKKNGGIQKAYDAMVKEAANQASRAASLDKNVDCKVEEIADLRQKFETVKEQLYDANLQKTELWHLREELVTFIIEQAQKCSSTDLREKAIELVGEKAYLTWKLEHKSNMWQLDIDLLVKILKHNETE